jgi:hypothetical protein
VKRVEFAVVSFRRSVSVLEMQIISRNDMCELFHMRLPFQLHCITGLQESQSSLPKKKTLYFFNLKFADLEIKIAE